MTSRTSGRLRRLILRALVAAGVVAAALYVFRAPLLSWIGRGLVLADRLEPSDAIVVLGGGLLEREIEAVDLFRAGLAPRLAITTSPEPPAWIELRRRGVRVETLADQRLRYLTELGIPPDAVAILDGVVSTADEAQLIREWATRERLHSIILVTSTYHSRRACLAFRRALSDTSIRLRCHPARFDQFDPDTWWHSYIGFRDALFEWQKLIFYWIRHR